MMLGLGSHGYSIVAVGALVVSSNPSMVSLSPSTRLAGSVTVFEGLPREAQGCAVYQLCDTALQVTFN